MEFRGKERPVRWLRHKGRRRSRTLVSIRRGRQGRKTISLDFHSFPERLLNISAREKRKHSAERKSDEKCKMIVNSSSEKDVQNDSFKMSHSATQHAQRRRGNARGREGGARGGEGGRKGGGEQGGRAGGGELRVQNRSLMTPSNIALGWEGASL